MTHESLLVTAFLEQNRQMVVSIRVRRVEREAAPVAKFCVVCPAQVRKRNGAVGMKHRVTRFLDG
ncbi:hypothetical protein [Paraburkholderia sp. CNPSo 3272]|uniref:hypothetical protein n=1 Tax=Paraburkholderia sp. CNPSo 3272 TaxID=2940931 RepID=UPI0035CD1BAB